MSATGPVAPGRPVRVVMIGDSITDAGRTSNIGDAGLAGTLGDGWVALVARALDERAAVANRGTGGDRLADLAARWGRDVVDLEPDLVSVAVGINDTWRRYDHDETSDVGRFEELFEALVSPLTDAGTPVVLVEPWVLPLRVGQERWHEDLDPRREAVARLARRTGATFVAAQAAMSARSGQLGVGALVLDGVHPTPEGHRVLADAWLAAVDLPGGATP